MAFFNILNDLAKNLGDKTNDVIETGKLNSKVNAERSAAGEALKKIGEFYYNSFLAGEEVAPEVLELCQTVKTHYATAAEAQGEIERIRAENEAEKAAAAAARAAAQEQAKAQSALNTQTAAQPQMEGVVCPGCGVMNPSGTKFCRECGTKMELPTPEAVQAAAPRVCAGCNTVVAEGIKFCPTCGQKLA